MYLIYTCTNVGSDKFFLTHSASSGDGPEVYAEMLTKNLTPYVTTQVRCKDIVNYGICLISETDISSTNQENLLLCIFCSQVSTHAAKKKIAETSTMPRDFLKKYDELKSKK